MKSYKKIILASLAIPMLYAFQSCTSEAPFSSSGTGTVTFKTEMYGDITFATRDISAESKADLESRMTIYIENNKGVLYRFIGKEQLPPSMTLAVGDYAIEGWTGDSVPASFEKKYYRGYEAFHVEEGSNNPVELKMNIANVIVSINIDNLVSEYSDIKVTFNHSREALEFNTEKVEQGAKGYFMMPSTDTDLHYKVEVTSSDGKVITKEGDLKNVERAHEYSLVISSSEPVNNQGGALIQIKIEDINVLDKEFMIYPAPTFKAVYGVENIDLTQNQIICTDEDYKDLKLRVVSYGGLNHLSLTFQDPFTDKEVINGVNLRNSGQDRNNAVSALNSLGITYQDEKGQSVSDDTEESVNIHEGWFTFERRFFEQLDKKDSAYVIVLAATDGRDYTNTLKISIANSESAIERNLVGSSSAPDTYDAANPFAILATSAVVEGTIYSDDIEEYGIEYRKLVSGGDFKKEFASGTRANNQAFSVTLKDLEPGTTYEYRAFAKEKSTGKDFTESKTRTFTTEGKYTIPNADMSAWSLSSKTIIPSADGNVTYWDTGNHGSILTGVNLTQSDTQFSPGNTVARLRSQVCGLLGVNKLAAGNIFTGRFAGRSGMNGKLELGREYNGSHPSGLKVKVNYTAALVGKDGANNKYIPQGSRDIGQIYIALTTSIVNVDTSSESTLFNPDADSVIAYGEFTFNEDTNSSGFVDLTIPFKYKDSSKTINPKYIVIVCSASKYGDYFCGAEGSLLYVDDFELEYGDIQFAN